MLLNYTPYYLKDIAILANDKTKSYAEYVYITLTSMGIKTVLFKNQLNFNKILNEHSALYNVSISIEKHEFILNIKSGLLYNDKKVKNIFELIKVCKLKRKFNVKYIT